MYLDESETFIDVPQAIWESVVTNEPQIVMNIPVILDKTYISQSVVLSGSGPNGAVTVGNIYDRYNSATHRRPL